MMKLNESPPPDQLKFALKFHTVINGKTNDLSLSEFSGGAHILFIFYQLFNVILYRYCIVNICHY